MRSEFYITPISIPLMIKSLLHVCMYDLDGNWFLTCDKHMRSKKNIILNSFQYNDLTYFRKEEKNKGIGNSISAVLSLGN